MNPDLVILDMQTNAIRRTANWEALGVKTSPATTVTSYDASSLMPFASAADLLIKPFNVEQFQDAIETARLKVNRARATRVQFAPRQLSLGWHTIVSAKYVGNHDEDEELTNRALNAFSPTGFGGLPTTVSNGEFGAVAQTQNVGNTNYNGVVISAMHSVSGGFQFQAPYTYSHALQRFPTTR